MFVRDLVGEDRMRDDFDLGHRSLEFEETAAHVIPGGDEPQAVKALLSHPLSRLAGIAEGVYRPVAEYDAAGGTLSAPLQILARAAQKILSQFVMEIAKWDAV